MSKLTIDDGEDNQEVTGVTTEGRSLRDNSLFWSARHYEIPLPRNLRRAGTFRESDDTTILAKAETTKPAIMSASRIVKFISPPF
jgi:hypothetical protein